MEDNRKLEDIYLQSNRILWIKYEVFDTKKYRGIWSIGGGTPNVKVRTYHGNLDDLNVIVSKASIKFFDMDNFLNLDPKYPGPFQWYEGELRKTGYEESYSTFSDFHKCNHILDFLFDQAVSKYRRKNISLFFKHLVRSFSNSNQSI